MTADPHDIAWYSRSVARELRRDEKRNAQKRFLRFYVREGSIKRACEKAKISGQRHYHWLWNDAEYRQRFEIAREAVAEIVRAKRKKATELLEEEAWRRALVGLPRKRFTGKGQPIIDPATGEQYVEWEKSERILLRLLEANCPQKYRNALQVVQQTGVQVQQIAGDVAAMAASIPPPAEAVEAAARARIIEEHGAGGNGRAEPLDEDEDEGEP